MTENSATQGMIPVEVVLAMPQVQYQQEMLVEASTTARQVVLKALQSGLLPPMASIDVDPASAPLGVFAERVEDDYVCQSGDRVEIYRPLQQDPMELRRQRARQSPTRQAPTRRQ